MNIGDIHLDPKAFMTKDAGYELHIANEWLKTLEDPEQKRKLFYRFARIGIFNPRTVFTEMEKWRTQWSQGEPGNLNDQWYLHRWGVDDPVVLKSMRFKITKVNGHRRKNSYWYKGFTIEETIGKLQAVAHAFERYRERTGRFVSHDDFHVDIPPLISGVQRQSEYDDNEQADYSVRNDIMLPTEHGSWLGQTLWCGDLNAKYIYKKGKGMKIDEDKLGSHGFRALTYIDYNDMFDWQRQIWHLHKEGKYDEANNIQKNNVNENQIKQIRTGVTTINKEIMGDI
jgi:hypothetical protein|tara:strand:- start:194 stop:1045 length:852 start_codon:yes stop_codon:yes gene_type:complete